MSSDEEPNTAHAEMSLGDHLDKLRSRLFKGVVAIVICTIVAWNFRSPLYQAFLRPFNEATTMLSANWLDTINQRLADNPELVRSDYFLTDDPEDNRLLPKYEVEQRPQVTAWQEGFMIKLKVCMYAAVAVGGPYLLWQLWAFIAAGLYQKERRAVLSFFPTSIALFYAGILFGYFYMVPFGMYYLGSELSPEEAVFGFKLDLYFTLVSSLCIALGAVFQLPLLMIALSRVGLVEPKTYATYRGHFVLASTVIAAILTPPDPITLLLMAGPMIVLYEIGYLAARWFTPADEVDGVQPA